jgi:hydrogenase maturation factor
MQYNLYTEKPFKYWQRRMSTTTQVKINRRVGTMREGDLDPVYHAFNDRQHTSLHDMTAKTVAGWLAVCVCVSDIRIRSDLPLRPFQLT